MERRKAFTLDHALGRGGFIGTTAVQVCTDGNPQHGHQFTGAGPSIEFDLGGMKPISRLGLSEAIREEGQSISGFTVDALVEDHWQEVGGAGTVGAHRLVRFEHPVNAQHWRVNITSARSAFALAAVNLWEELSEDPGLPTHVHVDPTRLRTGTGSRERPLNSLAHLGTLELAPGGQISFRAGTDCMDHPVTLWGYGTEDSPLRINTYGEGAPATVGGKSLSDRFSAHAAQGWVVVDGNNEGVACEKS